MKPLKVFEWVRERADLIAAANLVRGPQMLVVSAKLGVVEVG